jgi:hypothetical protein
VVRLGLVARFEVRPARAQRREQPLAVAHDAPARGRAPNEEVRALLLQPVEPVRAAAAIDLGHVDDHHRRVIGALQDARHQRQPRRVRVLARERFESVTPARVSAAALRGRSATHAMTIGPKTGPRPASSTPRMSSS